MRIDRQQFIERVQCKSDDLVALCVKLVRINSENPPGDTGAIVGTIEEVLGGLPGINLERVTASPPCTNLLARLSGGGPGRRLVLNGHLDTFPIGDPSSWTVPPLGGAIADGRIYGRGASDMKAGLAVAIMTTVVLAEIREYLAGELVLACVADEETGGHWGTKYLLDNVDYASGDAMLSGDAGSPHVLRFGEKGQVWLELVAQGVSNHGAHVHLGKNAIEPLIAAIQRICELRNRSILIPSAVLAAMADARPVSEALSGAGEFDTLRSLTVNIGVINGGQLVNIIPDRACARLDIRFPPGLTVAEVLGWIDDAIADVHCVDFAVLQAFDPTVTDPTHELAALVLGNARALRGPGVVANMRVGMSDARFYREHGIPTIVYGPTPNNMGGVDEYVTIEDLVTVFYVHALTAFDYLSRDHTGRA